MSKMDKLQRTVDAAKDFVISAEGEPFNKEELNERMKDLFLAILAMHEIERTIKGDNDERTHDY